MSTDKQIEDWRAIKEQMLANSPVPLKGWAIVGVPENGAPLHWGASFPLTESECNEMARKLRAIAHDVTQHGKSKYAAQ